MASVPSSEDEFPNVEVIVRRHKQKTTGQNPDRDIEAAPRQAHPPKPEPTISNEAIGKTSVAIRRRRKLGPGQPVGGSLKKPWQSLEVGRGTGNRTKSPLCTQTRVEETIREPLDHFPVKTKHAESRGISGRGTAFDSPPREPKRTRRLISRGEKKALDQKRAHREDDWIVSSDSSDVDSGEEDISSAGEDDESDFIRSGDPDSDAPPVDPLRHVQSPSGPPRMPRRILPLSRDSGKKEAAWTKSIRDSSLEKPQKRSNKQGVRKLSSTRQLKAEPNGNLEDVFDKLKIFNEEPDELLVPEPTTPRKHPTASPVKAPRIPASPWKPEHKEFWDPEVNFAWIDQHSPPKKSMGRKVPGLPAADSREELRRRYGTSPEKKQARKTFDAVKADLARDFLLELDEVITGGELGRLTETTGGLRIVWSNTLLTTAGRAHWKCKTTTTTSAQPAFSSSSSLAATKRTATQHYAHIELAIKVLTNESDLLNTVAHEFCHLAVFLLHGKPKLAHGAEFKTYGRRVMSAAAATLGDDEKGALKIPRNRNTEINVTTRHSYEIEYRFIWRCADCAAEVRRHSRSVDPMRQRCGRCKGGVLVQVKPVPRGAGAGKDKNKGNAGDALEKGGLGTGMGMGVGKGRGQKTEVKKKQPTAYQEFTSREMKALGVSHKGLSFGEKMTLVSARWGEHQKKLAESKTSVGTETGASADGRPPSVRGLTAAVEVLGLGD